MWGDGWADLPAHLMTISCKDERKSSEEEEEEERQLLPSAVASFFI